MHQPHSFTLPCGLLGLVGLFGSACGGGQTPSSSSGAKPAASAPAAAEGADAEPTPGAEPSAEPTPAELTPKDAAPDDWLVWFRDDRGWVTRWIDAADPELPRVAERRALVLSDGKRLWGVQRHDAKIDVVSCDCLEQDEGSPACAPAGSVATLGLRAVPLGAQTTATAPTAVEVRPPATEPTVGEDIHFSLDVIGGVGPRLHYRWTESGYFCGAHGLSEGADVVFDVARGTVVEDPFGAVDSALPTEVREQAGREVLAGLRECDGSDAPTLAQVLDDRMDLTGVEVSLVDGAPELRWSYESDVYYACSADYAVHGQVRSLLVDAGAPLGLSGPLPEGLQHELERIGRSPTVGWSHLELTGAARTTAIAAFGRAPEQAWPPSRVSSQALAVPAPAGLGSAAPSATPDETKAERAKLELSKGRALTRAGTYDEAVATFDAAIALDPGMGKAWSERGYAKLLAADLEGAKADLEHGLSLDDGASYQASIYFNLGLVAERGGDREAAKAAFERSLELREHAGVRKALARVQE
ncbi:MAG: tetratricopeptide repeat protein [Nannocystaceae bacterium]